MQKKKKGHQTLNIHLPPSHQFWRPSPQTISSVLLQTISRKQAFRIWRQKILPLCLSATLLLSWVSITSFVKWPQSEPLLLWNQMKLHQMRSKNAYSNAGFFFFFFFFLFMYQLKEHDRERKICPNNVCMCWEALETQMEPSTLGGLWETPADGSFDDSEFEVFWFPKLMSQKILIRAVL